jgi:hypothetical protein
MYVNEDSARDIEIIRTNAFLKGSLLGGLVGATIALAIMAYKCQSIT